MRTGNLLKPFPAELSQTRRREAIKHYNTMPARTAERTSHMRDIPSINGEVVSRRDRFDKINDLDELRAEKPVTKITIPSLGSKTKQAWLVTRYDDVRKILGDASLFLKSQPPRRPVSEAEPKPQQKSLAASNPSEHTYLRRLLAPEFSKKRLDRLIPRIEAITTECLDAMERSGPPVNLVQEFAQPISLLTLCELLGIPRHEAAEFQQMRDTMLGSGRSGEKRVLVANSGWANMAKLPARQRVEPDDTLFGSLIRQHGDELTDDELSSIGNVVLIAGYDNMAAMLSLGTLLLLDQPSHFALLRDDPDIADNMIEEMLRYLSVVSAPQARTATADVRFGDQVIKKGDSVICSLASANRDEILGEEMDRFDPNRNPVAHVAFGHGIRFCLGAQLARLEMKIAYLALLHRFPKLQLAAPFTDLSFRSFPSYCIESLPVKW
jgi:cytochrome P450